MVKSVDVYLYEGELNPEDIRLRPMGYLAQHIYKMVTEVLGLVDSHSHSKFIHREIVEILGILDTILRMKSIHRIFIDKIGQLDSIIHILTGGAQELYRIITEYLANLDTRSRIANKYKQFTEGIGVLDSITTSVVYYIYRIITEKLGLSDSIIVLKYCICVLRRILSIAPIDSVSNLLK